MEWAIEECLKTSLPVGASMCIGPEGDMHGVSAAECAIRMARAGAHIGEKKIQMSFRSIQFNQTSHLKFKYLRLKSYPDFPNKSGVV